MRILHDHCEHDRRESAWTEPSHKRNRRRSGVGAKQRQGHRQHANDGQAQHGVEHDLPTQVLERWTEQHRSEDQECHAVERESRFLGESHRLCHLVAGKQTEEGAGHEGGDESGPSAHGGRPVGGERRGQRDDLPPGRFDQTSPSREDDDSRGKKSRAGATEDSVANLLGDHAKRMNRRT